MQNQKGMALNQMLIMWGIVAVIIIGAIYMLNTSKESQEDVMMEEGESMMKEEGESMMEAKNGETMMEDHMEGETMMEEESMMKKSSYTGEVIAGTSAPLLDFNQADYEQAKASNKVVVLYFYANWCPICAEETKTALYPYFNELDNENVIGFRVNFNDNQTDKDETALAREYGVAYQHTKVILKNGQRVQKSPESWTIQQYVDAVSSALAI